MKRARENFISKLALILRYSLSLDREPLKWNWGILAIKVESFMDRGIMKRYCRTSLTGWEWKITKNILNNCWKQSKIWQNLSKFSNFWPFYQNISAHEPSMVLKVVAIDSAWKITLVSSLSFFSVRDTWQSSGRCRGV